VVQRGINTSLAVQNELIKNDFIAIPVVLGQPGEPMTQAAVMQDGLPGRDLPHLAWPIGLGDWRGYLSSEVEAAKRQEINAYDQGIAIVLKLNGRVGKRAFGAPNWRALIEDVDARRRRGMDVTNI
jgi:hypothetical protein